MPIYSNGELASSTDAVQMPAVRFQNGYLKAKPGNTGNIYVGSSSDVSLANGSTDADTTTGYPLDAGDVFIMNKPGILSDLWYICDTAGDSLIYFVENF